MTFRIYILNLPVAILKLLVLSHLRYAVSVWGPSFSHDLQSRLEKMFNRAIRVVYGLRKFDHVCTLRRKLGWLSVQSLIQHHCLFMLYRHYHSDVENTIQLSPPIKFGKQSCCDTKTAPYFAAPNRYRLSFTQNFFCSKGTCCWNILPSYIFTQSSNYFHFKKQTLHHLLEGD